MYFVLCDDNEAHNERLSRMLRDIISTHSLECSIALVATSADPLLEYAAQNTEITLYFLDLDLGNGGSGVSLANAIRVRDPRSYIVYISAHIEYAIECLRTKASDFLVKPFLFSQLEQCVLGIIRDSTLMGDCSTFSITIGSITHMVSQNDILFFEKQREYIMAITSDQKYRWRESYSSLFCNSEISEREGSPQFIKFILPKG